MTDTKKMIAVMQAYTEGKPIEVYNKILREWFSVDQPIWDWANKDYRVKEEPKPKPFVQWDLINPEYNYLFRTGNTYNSRWILSKVRPSLVLNGERKPIHWFDFKGITVPQSIEKFLIEECFDLPNDCPWYESLICRPGVEE